MKLLHLVFAGVLAVFSAVSFAQAIDINTATAEQLDKEVKGIGPKKAADIVKYREANGPFQSVDDLTKVPGIKARTLEKIKPMVTVGAEPAAPATPATPAMPATRAMPATPAVSAPAAPVAPIKPAMPASTAPAKLTPAAPAPSTMPAPAAPR